MASRFIDLAEDSHETELPVQDWVHKKTSISNQHQPPSRQPLATRQNNARPRANAISEALDRAIDGMDISILRHWVKEYVAKDVAATQSMQSLYLVTGKDIVRYHADTDSENGIDSSNESEEEEEQDDKSDDKGEISKKLKPIFVGDDEVVPRNAKCLNCDENFDVDLNMRGDCNWHPGRKDLYHDSDFWADHDDDCHGDPWSFHDDPDYDDGFIWTCCDKTGSDTGCKSTKHKAIVNQIQYFSHLDASANRGLKRKASEEIAMPSKKPQTYENFHRTEYPCVWD